MTVTRNAMGELMVDFREYGWFPRSLPSEGDEELESSSGEESEVDEDEDVSAGNDNAGSSGRRRR